MIYDIDYNLLIFFINNFLLNDKINSKLLIRILHLLKFNKKNISDVLDHYNFDLKYIYFELEDLNKYKELINKEYNNNFIKHLDIRHLYDYNHFYNLKKNKIKNLNFFCNLKILNLIENRELRDNDIKYLKNLTDLILPKNKLITDNAIINLNNLINLDLTFNKNITDNGIKNKLKLEKVVLTHNQNITDNAFKNMNNLKIINLGYNRNKNLNFNFIFHNKKLKEVCIFNKELKPNILNYMKNNIEELICPENFF
jgi:hypothetical protein